MGRSTASRDWWRLVAVRLGSGAVRRRRYVADALLDERLLMPMLTDHARLDIIGQADRL